MFDFLLLEKDVANLAENMKPYTEQSMKIERAPWLPEDFIDTDELYTELSPENISQTPKGPK